MIISYSYSPVIEEMLISRLAEYFNTVDWRSLYPNHPLRINNEYPWVPYMSSIEHFDNGWLDLNTVNETLFPSITIVTSQDAKSPEVFAKIVNTTLEKDDLEEFKAQAGEDGYMISPDSLIQLDAHFATNDYLYGVNVVYQRQDTVNIDITVDDNTNIKNRIYDYIYLFLVGHGNTALKQDHDIQIIGSSISGSRSGTYNVDFGRVLRGSSIEMQVDYKISQVYYDTDATLITEVNADHTTEVIS